MKELALNIDNKFVLTVNALKLQAYNLPMNKEIDTAIIKLDKGMQVLLSDYPELKLVYDIAYSRLMSSGWISREKIFLILD